MNIDIKQERFERIRGSNTFRNIVKVFSLKDKNVFDIGCGNGEYLEQFGQGSVGITTNLGEVHVTGVRGLNVIAGNAEELQKLDKSHFKDIEYIWANNFFEHILSPHAFLMRLNFLVPHGTVMILGVPVIPYLYPLLLIKRFKGALANTHISFFTSRTLKNTVEKGGWSVREIRPFYFRNSFLDMLLNFISPHQYVVAVSNRNFKYPVKKLGEWKDENFYREYLEMTNQIDYETPPT